MVELTKKYPIVYKGKYLVFPLTEEGVNGKVYPAKDTEYAEFDTYEDAQAFIKEQGLKEPTRDSDINYEVQG